MHFLDGDFKLLNQESMLEAGITNPFVASATGLPREWTGLTNFWAAGVEPEAVVLTEAYYQPRAKADIIEVLEGGVIDRNSLPNCQLTAIGL